MKTDTAKCGKAAKLAGGLCLRCNTKQYNQWKRDNYYDHASLHPNRF